MVIIGMGFNGRGYVQSLALANTTENTLFFQSALCRQSAVETKSQNQGQSGTRQGQIGTRVGQFGTGEGQNGTGTVGNFI